MEAYVSRREYQHVIKELKRLQAFLTDTFGSKFSEFQSRDDHDEDEIKSRQFFGPDSDSDTLTTVIHRRRSQTMTRASSTEHCDEDAWEDDSGNIGPVVTSTKSLQFSNQAPIPNVVKSSAGETVPFFSTDNPSMTQILSVPTEKSTKTSKSMRIDDDNASQNLLRSPKMEVIIEQPGMVHQQSPSLQPQSQPLIQTIPKPKLPAGDLQLRGRTLFCMSANSSTANSIGDEQETSNDSVPIPIGYDSMEESKSPYKRTRPAPLPSFRKRSLGLQSLKPTSTVTVPVNPNSSEENEKKIIQCDLCSLFIYSSEVDSHRKFHSLVKAKIPENANANNPLMKKTHVCPICRIECIDYQMYELHCKESHQEVGFPCPICNRRMSSKSKLKRHMSIHRNLKFECRICGKAYNRSDNLTAHYKTHGNNKEATVFYCSVCNYAFSSRIGRDKHLEFVHPAYRNSQNECLPDYDSSSSENESVCASTSTTAEAVISQAEKIEIEPINMTGVEFEYEGDDDEL